MPLSFHFQYEESNHWFQQFINLPLRFIKSSSSVISENVSLPGHFRGLLVLPQPTHEDADSVRAQRSAAGQGSLCGVRESYDSSAHISSARLSARGASFIEKSSDVAGGPITSAAAPLYRSRFKAMAAELVAN